MARGKTRKFVFVHGTNKSYVEQGLIFFTCANVKKQPEEIQQKILNLCLKVGGEYYQALYTFLTDTRITADMAARKSFTSEKKIYVLRKKFYNAW